MTDRPTLDKSRDLGGIVSDSVTLFFGDLPAMLAIVTPSLFVGIPALALGFLASLVVKDDYALGLSAVFVLPLLFAAQTTFLGGIVFRLLELDSGSSSSIQDALRTVLRRFPDLMATAVKAAVTLYALLLAPSLIVLFLPGLPPAAPPAILLIGVGLATHRAVMWLFFIPAIMAGQEPASSALRYSAWLVRGNWWNTFGRWLVGLLLAFVPIRLASLVVSSFIPALAAALIGAVLALLSFSFLAVFGTLMFYDLRTRKNEAQSELNRPY